MTGLLSTYRMSYPIVFFFFQAEDGIRDYKVTGVQTCALPILAVGIKPNVALARTAGLDIGRGIQVDDHMVTSDPSILAVGECVEHRGSCYEIGRASCRERG